jgi:DNA-binding IscR family transcriptional regulator
MNNQRFAISLHILTLLTKSKDERISSDYIAGSININPVIVRKELSNLNKYGFVTTKEGKNGGTVLAKPENEINLADVYLSVRPSNILGNTPKDPNPQCPVGRQINRELEKLYLLAEDALLTELRTKTLADFCKEFV